MGIEELKILLKKEGIPLSNISIKINKPIMGGWGLLRRKTKYTNTEISEYKRLDSEYPFPDEYYKNFLTISGESWNVLKFVELKYGYSDNVHELKERMIKF